MHAHHASSAVPCFVPRGHVAAPRRATLPVDTIGHLRPRTAFAGRVHSVFARACNIVCGSTWLTLCTHDAGNGPTVLRLARGAALDLRVLFSAGERVDGDGDGLRSARVEIALRGAGVWRPAEPMAAALPAAAVETNLRLAGERLARHRIVRPGVIDREAAAVTVALAQACRALDGEQVARHAARLIGWGEGLTPAGDDFLIGLIAGLDVALGGDARRAPLRETLARALVAGCARTTPVAAHYLRLAAAGHYNEPLLRLRAALRCEHDVVAVDAALRSALAVGATSGADTVCGLLAGLRAWLPAATAVETP
jgi:hypothetical protein